MRKRTINVFALATGLLCIAIAAIAAEPSSNAVSVEQKKAAENVRRLPPRYVLDCQAPRDAAEVSACEDRLARKSSEEANRLSKKAEESVLLDSRTNVVSVSLSALGLAGIILTLHYTRKATLAAQNSLDVARKALVAERRPWVGVLGANVTRLDVSQDEVKAKLEIKILNAGGSPAHEMAIKARLIAERRPEGTVEDIKLRFRAVRTLDDDPDAMGILLPGQEQTLKFSIVGDPGELQTFPIEGAERRLIFTICGFVVYRSNLAEEGKIHATTFIYRVFRNGQNHLMWPVSDTFVIFDEGVLETNPWPHGWLAD